MWDSKAGKSPAAEYVDFAEERLDSRPELRPDRRKEKAIIIEERRGIVARALVDTDANVRRAAEHVSRAAVARRRSIHTPWVRHYWD